MSKENKTFPQTELEEEIYRFWSIRGFGEVTAVLGNLDVSLHRDNPRYNSLGISYIYLEQFYKQAQEKAIKEFSNKLDKWIDLESKDDNDYVEFSIDDYKEFKKGWGI